MKPTLKAMIAAGVIAAVVIGVLVLYGGEKQSASNVRGLSKDAPDLVMSGGVSFVEMEGDQVVWKANAESATYNIETAVLTLEKTSAEHLKDATPEYEMSGNSGTYDTKTRIMNMQGGVSARRFSGYH